MTTTYDSGTQSYYFDFHSYSTAPAGGSFRLTPVTTREYLCDVFFEDGSAWLNLWLTSHQIESYRREGISVMVNPWYAAKTTIYNFDSNSMVTYQ